MTNFEPYEMRKIEITDAQEYGQYVKCTRVDGKVWNIVSECLSIIDVGGQIIVKLHPFYTLPIQLRVKHKTQIIRIKSNNE